tara:strand:- start:606 stop:779 length:174 start_codon:yes stop_codon:yes gene_type:complete
MSKPNDPAARQGEGYKTLHTPSTPADAAGNPKGGNEMDELIVQITTDEWVYEEWVLE